jgi:four helix bundle protein
MDWSNFQPALLNALTGAAFPRLSRNSGGGLGIADWQGMNPKALALQKRTRAFLRRVIRFAEELPDHVAVRRIVPQLLDAAGGAASNYRSACRSRSTKEFIAKIGVAAEEADESKGWLEVLVDANLADSLEATPLIREADELTAIFVASRKTAQAHMRSGGRRLKIED